MQRRQQARFFCLADEFKSGMGSLQVLLGAL
jgi:hypothetical protein